MSTVLDEQYAPSATGTAQADAPVRTIVARHVEQATRFDDTDLGKRQADAHATLQATICVEHDVAFEIRHASGAGALPHAYTRVDGKFAMDAALTQGLHSARAQCGDALARWAGAESTSYLRPLPASAAFLHDPVMAGFDHTCITCRGACQLTCSQCAGRGQNLCTRCGGSRTQPCHQCGGSKTQPCGSCGGQGGTHDTVTAQVWDASSGSYVSDTQTHYRSCGACGGGGRSTCHSCDHAGQVPCGQCDGMGNVGCGPCARTGKLNCSSCAASGTQYTSGRVAAAVTDTTSGKLDGDDAAASAIAAARIKLVDLPAHGALLAVRHAPAGTSVLSTYTVRVDVRRAALHAGGQDFAIHGFGPAHTVFDFCNIAGHMLADDLTAFEAQVDAARAWYRARGPGLLEASARFLRSELNMAIVEQASSSASALAHGAFQGLVDADYIARTAAVLRRANARLYGDQMRRPAVLVCLLAALGAGVAVALQWPTDLPLINVVACVALAGLAWRVFEAVQQWRIARCFEGGLGKRIVARMRADGSVKKWRAGMLGATLALSVAAMFGAVSIPSVRAQHQQQRLAQSTRQDLAGWEAQTEADYRLRSYPTQDGLRQQVQAGNAAARLVLGWQLLLGAGGAARDIPGAAALLEQPGPDGALAASYAMARAVLVLHQQAGVQAQRAAAGELGQIGTQEHAAEAQYWQARALLDAGSPIRNNARGVKALESAARAHHAHAALLLGQMYASGTGVRANRRSARLWLTQADVAGMPEAQQALAQLR